MDNINPPYYKDKSIETIKAIKSQVSSEQFEGYLRCSVLKYVSRYGGKRTTTKQEDINKAIKYITWLKDHIEPAKKVGDIELDKFIHG